MKTRKKKTWMLVGTGFEVETDEISCDIVCKETDKVLTVYITNTEKSRNILEKILENDCIFKIPKDIYVRQEKWIF